jgi:hypothetical protein
MVDLGLTLLAMLAVLGAAAVGGYFLFRRLFVQAAEQASAEAASVLNRIADRAAAGVGRAASSAAAGGVGRAATPWIRYLRAEGVDDAGARREFASRIERLAKLMDSAVTVPVIGPVGLDAVLGLFPFVGDATSAAIALSLVARSLRYGIPRELVTKMLANVLVDLLLGAVPLVGDLGDIWYRANARNVALLREYLDRPVDG